MGIIDHIYPFPFPLKSKTSRYNTNIIYRHSRRILIIRIIINHPVKYQFIYIHIYTGIMETSPRNLQVSFNGRQCTLFYLISAHNFCI